MAHFSKTEIKKMIEERPQGVSPQELIESMLAKGHTLEGYVKPGPKGEKGEKGDCGPMGPMGPMGPKGDKGDKGDCGERGPMGLMGRDGRDGRDGKDGKDGDIKDLSPQEIRDSLELLSDDERLDAKYIKNLPQPVIQGYHGGFIETPIRSGSNISVTKDAFGYVISSLGGGASSGTDVPTSTPSALGSIYIDTSTSNIYISVGTSSSADWKLIASY